MNTCSMIHILLVDDSEDDIEFTRKALEETKLANSVSVVYDGIEAMTYLRKRGTVCQCSYAFVDSARFKYASQRW